MILVTDVMGRDGDDEYEYEYAEAEFAEEKKFGLKFSSSHWLMAPPPPEPPDKVKVDASVSSRNIHCAAIKESLLQTIPVEFLSFTTTVNYHLMHSSKVPNYLNNYGLQTACQLFDVMPKFHLVK